MIAKYGGAATLLLSLVRAFSIMAACYTCLRLSLVHRWSGAMAWITVIEGYITFTKESFQKDVQIVNAKLSSVSNFQLFSV